MKEQLYLLLQYACKMFATDIHIVLSRNKLRISIRTPEGFIPLQQDIFDARLLEYLKFISGMDLCARWTPQSGQFVFSISGRSISCRFSLIENREITTGVIRLLHMQADMPIDRLTHNPQARKFLHSLCQEREGLFISCGPTGSGKSTTIHAVLHEMAACSRVKIVSLEDPVEIPDDTYLQLEISESTGFTYEKGIEELMRHDPDVIFIGECRSAYTARMAVRAALTGHLVFTTLHAGSGRECLHRLLEFGVSQSDLETVLRSIFAQRLFPGIEGRECVYEIWHKKDLNQLFQNQQIDLPSLKEETAYAEREGWISGKIQKNEI